MKRICLFLLSALCALPVVCFAQCPSDKGQVDFYGCYGWLTAGQTTGDRSMTYSSGAAAGGVRYFLYNRLAIGIAGLLTTERGETSSRFGNAVTGDYQRTITTVAAELYYIYYFRRYMEVYTILGAGPAFVSTTSNITPLPYLPATTATEGYNKMRLQYTPIGVRVGGRIGVFGEFGIGYKGVVCVGLSVKLGSSCWWKG